MATTYKSPAERIEARQRARASKLATSQAKSAAYYRAHAEKAQGVNLAQLLTTKAEKFEQCLASTGRCIRCGRVLTDPKSVAGSVGPECAKKAAR